VLRCHLIKDEVSVARDLTAPLLGAHAAGRGRFWRGTSVTFNLIQSNTAPSSECTIGRFIVPPNDAARLCPEHWAGGPEKLEGGFGHGAAL
jgi:hypothetical protein